MKFKNLLFLVLVTITGSLSFCQSSGEGKDQRISVRVSNAGLNDSICDYLEKNTAVYRVDQEVAGYCTFYDLDQAMEYAHKMNRPLFIHFTCHACANSRRMEARIWPMQQVEKILANEYVMVSLYVDDLQRLEEPIIKANGKRLRTIGQKWQDLEEVRYGMIAQPWYVLADLEGENLVEPRGYTNDPDVFAGFLQSGLAEFQKRISSD